MFRIRLGYKVLAVLIAGLAAFIFIPDRSQATPVFVVSAANSDPSHPTEVFSIVTNETSLATVFAQAGRDYHPEDRIQVFPPLGTGLASVVSVTRALPVTLVDGKHSYLARTWSHTVGEFLKEKNVELGTEDKVNPILTTALQPDETITITRVARTIVIETEAIPFESKTIENPSRYRGETTVTQQGENGEREKKYEVIREDGEQISKTLIGNTIIKKMIAKITEIGTKLKLGASYSGKATYYENNLGTKVATDKFKRGTRLLVTNLNNGKKIEVINDGCICGATGVLIDLNPNYFQQLGGTLGQGVLQNVRVDEVLN